MRFLPTSHSVLIVSALLFAGCTPVRPWRVHPIPTGRSYADFGCPELDTEARAIEADIVANSRSYKSGTRQTLGILRGRAEAVNEQIARNVCHVPPVNLLITRKKKPTRLYY